MAPAFNPSTRGAKQEELCVRPVRADSETVSKVTGNSRQEVRMGETRCQDRISILISRWGGAQRVLELRPG